ncbi:hypothetical protein C8F04DRAFT_1122035, partial [Mycena alexandri]
MLVVLALSPLSNYTEMAAPALPSVDVIRLTGPMILGYMFSYGLYGVLVVQIYMYTELFPRDRPGLKTLVWVMFFFETFFTVLMTIAAWNMFGTGFGNESELTVRFNWTWGTLPMTSGCISALAQGFYIWRIWHLTNSLWLPIPIALAVLGQLIGLWWFALKWNIEHWGVAELPPLVPGVATWLGGSAFCDVLITITLTFVLWRRKKETKFSETTTVINRLIRMSVETGALTSLVATAETILFVGWDEWWYHFTLFLILGKLYSNVMLATLNCRVPLSLTRGHGSHGMLSPEGHVSTSFWSEPNEKGRDTNGTGVQFARAVHVSRNIHVDTLQPDSIIMT